jgi:HEAT repeat protein
MKALWLLGIVVAALGVARASSNDLTQTALDVLTPIESSESSDQLTLVFGGGSGSAAETTAVTALVGIASDPTQDLGVQVRAIRDLGEYPEPSSHAELVSLLQAVPATKQGVTVVLSRAAIEAFGALAAIGGSQPGDTGYLVPLLGHASQDIRAATANALGNLCDPSAIQPLRNQLGQETVPQVQYAISEALGVLGGCAD